MTSEKIFISKEIRLSRQALRPLDNFFGSISFTNFVLNVWRKYLLVKSYKSKSEKCCRDLSSISESKTSVSAFWDTKMKIKPWGKFHLVYLLRKFQLRIYYSFGEKVLITRPSAVEKNAISQNRKWRHQNKEKYIKLLWLSIRHENFMKINPTEILCKNWKEKSFCWLASMRAHYVTHDLNNDMIY